jgi:DHA1 family tetracycline resistance protein-like MFS transporter
MPRVGELRFAVTGTSLLGFGFLGVAAAPTVWALYGAVAVLVAGFAMVTPSLSSLLSRRTPPDIQGEVLGVNQSGLSLARIIGPLTGNLLLGRSDAMPALVAAGGMVVCFSAAAVLRSRPWPAVAAAE